MLLLKIVGLRKGVLTLVRLGKPSHTFYCYIYEAIRVHNVLAPINLPLLNMLLRVIVRSTEKVILFLMLPDFIRINLLTFMLMSSSDSNMLLHFFVKLLCL